MSDQSLEIKRGDIWIADLSFLPENISIQRGKRPILCISNDKCNKFSPVITIVPLSSKTNKRQMITHVELGYECGLDKLSVALCEQIMSLDKRNLINKIGQCNEIKINQVNKAIDIQLERNCGLNRELILPRQNTYEFDPDRARKMAQSIYELENYLTDTNLKNNKAIVKSIQIQINNLEDYCKKFDKDISCFYKTKMMIYCGGEKLYA